MMAHNHLQIQSQGTQFWLKASEDTRHTSVTQTYMKTSPHIHIIMNHFFKKVLDYNNIINITVELTNLQQENVILINKIHRTRENDMIS